MLDKNDAMELKHSVRAIEVAVRRHHKLLETLAAKYRGQLNASDDEFQTLSGGTDKD